jgi:hypothetical protein
VESRWCGQSNQIRLFLIQHFDIGSISSAAAFCDGLIDTFLKRVNDGLQVEPVGCNGLPEVELPTYATETDDDHFQFLCQKSLQIRFRFTGQITPGSGTFVDALWGRVCIQLTSNVG